TQSSPSVANSSPPPTRPLSARAWRPIAPWARRPLGGQGPDLLPPGVGQQPTVSHHRPSFGRCVRFTTLLHGLPTTATLLSCTRLEMTISKINISCLPSYGLQLGTRPGLCRVSSATIPV